MEGVNAANQQILLLTVREVDKRIKEALYSNDVGCPETVLYELSQATYHAVFMERISKASWSCLKSSTSRARRIQKALTLLTYLALNGDDVCTSDIINHLDDITELHDRNFPESMRDLEAIIKDKAVHLVCMICDRQLLEKKRKEAAAIRSRFVGVTSNNGHVATQSLYKPIYAVEAKAGVIGRAASEASRRWNLVFHSIKENRGPGRIREMFNRVKNGTLRDASGNARRLMGTLDTRPEAEHNRTVMQNNYVTGSYKRGVVEKNGYRNWRYKKEPLGSEYEGSTSGDDSESSADTSCSYTNSKSRHQSVDSAISSLSTDSVASSDKGREMFARSRIGTQYARLDDRVAHSKYRGADKRIQGSWKYELEHQNNVADNMDRLSLSGAHRQSQLEDQRTKLYVTDRYENTYDNSYSNNCSGNPFARLSHY